MADSESRKILTNKDNILTVNILSSAGMSRSKPKEDLADYIRRVRTEKGLTRDQVAERSGGGVSGGYISQIENRYSINPTPQKMRALARGLSVSESSIYAIMQGKAPDEGEGFTRSRLGIISSRLAMLGKLSDKDKIKVDFMIESIERFLDDLEARVARIQVPVTDAVGLTDNKKTNHKK